MADQSCNISYSRFVCFVCLSLVYLESWGTRCIKLELKSAWANMTQDIIRVFCIKALPRRTMV